MADRTAKPTRKASPPPPPDLDDEDEIEDEDLEDEELEEAIEEIADAVIPETKKTVRAKAGTAKAKASAKKAPAKKKAEPKPKPERAGVGSKDAAAQLSERLGRTITPVALRRFLRTENGGFNDEGYTSYDLTPADIDRIEAALKAEPEKKPFGGKAGPGRKKKVVEEVAEAEELEELEEVEDLGDDDEVEVEDEEIEEEEDDLEEDEDNDED